MPQVPRVKQIAQLYYSNPKVLSAIFEFATDREVVPRFYQGFGKRPDALQYPSDAAGLVGKGATSFHCSEELWHNPLEISSDMAQHELTELRKGWDLLVDIDSPYLDYSKIAAKLIIAQLEKYGITNYGLKFSGSKGFHLIVPAKAFPRVFAGVQTAEMFPEWPRAISEFLLKEIRPEYNKIVSAQNINFKALEERTKLKKEDITQTVCPSCGKDAKKGVIVDFRCSRCATTVQRRDPKITKRKLKCIDDTCPGELLVGSQQDYFKCEHCGADSVDKTYASGSKVTYTQEARNKAEAADFKEEVSGEAIASLDLVLVASRHLFRMPYSLHEKTALASVVMEKSQIDSFSPRDAHPLKLKEVQSFFPQEVRVGEAEKLLAAALEWKKVDDATQEATRKKSYANHEQISIEGVTEEMFPRPIKKLMKGLTDGRKRGAFVLITFLRACNFSPEYINDKVREWNKKNDPPLKEGYLASQIDWHLKQKRKILPPNYSNPSFYRDLQLFDKPPQDKNPLSEIMRSIRRQKHSDQ